MNHPGKTLEAAIWLSGAETERDLIRFTADVRDALDQAATAAGVILGPPVAVTKYPGAEKVPPVPDHISGPDVRLLVIEAAVVGYAAGGAVSVGLFTHELEKSDLERLRRITRDDYAKVFPMRPRLTDRQCDTIINDLGPDAAVDSLMRGAADVARVLH